jgi:transcriptional regulator with XRE-family HTH domain
MPEFADVLANNVRAERSRRKLRQVDLAERLGWMGVTVSELETGRRTITAADLPKLCRALGVTLAKLTEGADPADVEALGL